MTLEDIKADMNSYAKKFPTQITPHISEAQEIIDPIHNYRRPKPTEKPNNKASEANVKQKNFIDLETKMSNTALSQGVPTLNFNTIQIA